MPGFGFGSHRAQRRRSSAPAPTPTPTPTPGTTRTAMPGGLTPALHYHPNSEIVTTSGGRLTGVAANTWSPVLTPSASGPLAQTDARGIKRWRGEGSEYLDGPTSWFANPRALTVFIVGRVIAPASTNNLFSISYLADGVTAFGGSAALRVLGTGGIAQWPYGPMARPGPHSIAPSTRTCWRPDRKCRSSASRRAPRRMAA